MGLELLFTKPLGAQGHFKSWGQICHLLSQHRGGPLGIYSASRTTNQQKNNYPGGHRKNHNKPLDHQPDSVSVPTLMIDLLHKLQTNISFDESQACRQSLLPWHQGHLSKSSSPVLNQKRISCRKLYPQRQINHQHQTSSTNSKRRYPECGQDKFPRLGKSLYPSRGLATGNGNSSPVPNPYTLLSLLGPEHHHYTVLDLKDAFFCISLAPVSQPIFAFEWTDPCGFGATHLGKTALGVQKLPYSV
ncbi:hypothetical protein AAY473_007981 [Plecturocebus cupreus]